MEVEGHAFSDKVPLLLVHLFKELHSGSNIRIGVINERKDDSALSGNDLLELGFSPGQARAPCGIVEYPVPVKELRALFGSKKRPLSDHSLCFLHEAKRRGARILGREPEPD
jgi:hypothetical protein